MESDLNDVDGDGWIAEEVGGNDCDDTRRRVRPDAEEIPYDGIDQNCDSWNDYDFDRDGYRARGEGGDDCNDFDAKIVPLDEDGDGFTPCSGDCDELDPNRFPGALPICGNGIEDNCDGVSDCAFFGTGSLEDAPSKIVGRPELIDFGWSLALPGDVDGDSAPEVVVASYTDPEGAAAQVSWFHTPLDALTTSDEAFASLVLPGSDIAATEAGDVDGDGAGDLLVAYDDGAGTARVGVVTGAPAGIDVAFSDAVWFEIEGLAYDRVGNALASLDGGSRIAVGAAYTDSGSGSVHLIAPVPQGKVMFGEGGALLQGSSRAYAGGALASLDFDGDGVSDLIVEETGLSLTPPAYARLVPNPPSQGVFALEQLSTTEVNLSDWGGALGGVAGADVDGDGGSDVTLGMPNFGVRVGAVAVFTSIPSGEVAPDDAPIIRYGLGDDTLGATLLVEDFDGDGAADLVVGAPATIGLGGGAYKPGALHVWYGPLQPGTELSLEADWYMLGAVTEARTLAAHDLAFGDINGDLHPDLLIASPRQQSGVVQIYPGGATAINGI